MATAPISSSSPPKLFFSSVKSKAFTSDGVKMNSLSLPCITNTNTFVTLSKTKVNTHQPFLASRRPLRKINAASEDVAISSEAAGAEASQQIASTGDDAVALLVQVLLVVAFVALSLLTVGVIYLGVTDFLQKRESDKFEKAEAANKKEGKKKRVRARSRAGPRGFGQKEEED